MNQAQAKAQVQKKAASHQPLFLLPPQTNLITTNRNQPQLAEDRRQMGRWGRLVDGVMAVGGQLMAG